MKCDKGVVLSKDAEESTMKCVCVCVCVYTDMESQEERTKPDATLL